MMTSDRLASEQAALADLLPIMIMMADPDGVVTFFNRRWYEFTGQPPFHKDAQQGWRACIHVDDVESVAQRWGQAVNDGTPVELTYRLREASTGIFHSFAARAEPIRDASGRIIKWLGTGMILEGLEAPQELRSLYSLQERVADTFSFSSTDEGSAPQHEALSRITVTLPKSLTDRLNAYRDSFRLSVSSIVEHAVSAYLERGHAEELIQDLRARGASLRRK